MPLSTNSSFTVADLGAAALLANARPALAADPAPLLFQTHAAFFSSETKLAKPIDPQVFVKDTDVAAATGPQCIKHVAGFRPAFTKDDPTFSALFNANGVPLGFTLGERLVPSGTVTMGAAGSGAILTMQFDHLRPSATYSVFENHFDQTPVGFTSLDGSGSKNSLKTDSRGAAAITIMSPQTLTHANALLVIFDDDSQAHGNSRGDVGINAQHQLIARPAD
jgi:hypothetical protein